MSEFSRFVADRSGDYPALAAAMKKYKPIRTARGAKNLKDRIMDRHLPLAVFDEARAAWNEYRGDLPGRCYGCGTRRSTPPKAPTHLDSGLCLSCSRASARKWQSELGRAGVMAARSRRAGF